MVKLLGPLAIYREDNGVGSISSKVCRLLHEIQCILLQTVRMLAAPTMSLKNWRQYRINLRVAALWKVPGKIAGPRALSGV